MADLLRFKKGLHENLDGVAKKAGTIYVTTDEQAMYVDISDSQRIRLSDIIQINSYAEWQTMEPPYSKTALYYIIEQNALLKYTGDGNTNHSWKQINSTSDIQADLNNLTQRVSTAETNITTVSNKATTLENAIGDATNPAAGSIRKRLNDIEAEQIEQNNRLTATEGVANAAKTAIGTDNSGENASGTLYQRIAQNKKDIASNATNITAINTKVGNSNDTSDKTTAFGRIKKLEETNASDDGRLDALETAVGAAGDAANADGSLYARVKKNASDISSLSTQVGTNKNDINTINTSITTLNNKNAEQDTAITGLRTDLGQPDASAGTNSAFARIKQLETTVGTQGGDVSQLKTDVENIKTKNNSQDDSINKNTQSITTLNNNVNTISEKVETNISDISDLKGRMTEAEGDIDDLEGVTGQIRTELGTKPADYKTVYEEIAQAKSDISKNTTSFTTLNNTVNGHTTTINGHTTKIGNLETAVGTANDTASASGSLYARVKKNAADIGTLNTSLGSASDSASANGSAYARIKQNANDIAGINTNITLLQQDLNKKASTDDLNKAKEDLLDEINDKITAANAMEFMGAVGNYNELPTTKVKIGYTYVASGEFSAAVNGKKVEAGDLLVANSNATDPSKKEDADGYITSGTLYWEVVNTGYIEAHENKIVDAGNDTLALQSYTGTQLSSITFEGAGAAKVDVTHTGSTTQVSKVTVSLEWETF